MKYLNREKRDNYEIKQKLAGERKEERDEKVFKNIWS